MLGGLLVVKVSVKYLYATTSEWIMDRLTPPIRASKTRTKNKQPGWIPSTNNHHIKIVGTIRWSEQKI
jgi:hypothetical protein